MLNRNDLADEIISYYIENRVDGREFWDLNAYAFAGVISDDGLIEAFSEKLATFKNEVDSFSILSRIGKNRSWNDHEIATLASFSSDDYYNLFKTHSGDDLSTIINGALQFDRISNASEPMREISKRAKDALAKIGGECLINARRVSRYGIRVGS